MSYRSASEHYKEIFGEKVYRIALDAGCTCPNRDGTKGRGGCIFCSGSGSGEFAADRTLDIPAQLALAKPRVEQKCKSHKYIAYFQNFTNTYGDEETLKEKFEAALSDPEVVGLSIATRPDSISEKMYRILEDLAQKTYVWIELGLQTIHEETAVWFHRGYDLSAFEQAVERLSKLSGHLETIVHVILDFPVETKDMMLETIRYCSNLTIQGIKIANLNVLRDTELAVLFEQKPFPLMDMDEYIDFLCTVVENIREDIVIYRMTGDGDKKHLIAPLWVANKRMVRNRITQEFHLRKIEQGRNFRPCPKE